ncbi:MAG: peptide ABC transporter substrate-binding protein [bacterium]|nr:peptide ABC transporter substrate-binding protein [bacterium]
MKLSIAMILGLLLCLGMVSAQEEPVTPPQPVVFRIASSADPNTFDPLFAESQEDITYTNNLFIGLTRINPQTGDILPSLANEWSVSEDGLTWTFLLRDDVYWVRYNTETLAFEQQRLITAEDMVYTVQRMCNSLQNGYYAVDVFAKRIAGCADGQTANDGTLAQASAPDATTFTITLNDPHGDFLTMTTIPAFRPQPREAIEALNTDWAYPNNIVTSGAFALSRFLPTIGITLLANPFYPADLWNGGNVAEVDIVFVQEFATQFDLYRNALLDIAGVPIGEVATVRADEAFTGQLVELQELTTFFIGFSTDKPPFDNVHVRRAFSAAIDRTAFVERVRFGYDQPVTTFIPQGITGAPEVTGVGYNPDYAREQMALSPYADCQNLPEVKMTVFRGAGSWGTYVVSQWVDLFGCDLARFTINEIGFNELLTLVNPIRTAAEERPNMFTMGWGADYADADSYASFIECGINNFFVRGCTSVDEQIAQARRVADVEERTALYTQIEEALFGVDGEFPLMPLYNRKRFILAQTWVMGAFTTDGRVGAVNYDAYTVDVKVRGENIRCEITNNRGSAINRRISPSTVVDIAGQIDDGATVRAIGQAIGDDGLVWWQLETGEWVRSDIVDESGQCDALPVTN